MNKTTKNESTSQLEKADKGTTKSGKINDTFNYMLNQSKASQERTTLETKKTAAYTNANQYSMGVISNASGSASRNAH